MQGEDDITPGRAALRGFKQAYDRSGSSAPFTTGSSVRPLHPKYQTLSQA